MRGARRQRRRPRERDVAAWLFFLACCLLVLAVSRAEEPRASPVSARGGGGGEEQRLSRVGSRPPCCVCEQRCGGCAPCTAVQVRAGVRPLCANYEPVRWKCKCGDAVFDP
ncbi:EPIDERMAL PATTERNING FACTOR-like protein 5 [Triticum aestivum]|uniref:EPIDERMAL PATTERNING FACTOR-like protein 5 n=1 Tax=Triticum aestivum TaxID=4565 RepID=UPI000843AB08|nr:EPIDERMAL PATTERNING FACTOR-like protein 5 [Triticum aestivum]XP_045090070.1 EPIDERMAL PATTERNING FACTOR-like protein 5 [Aegilops tauschii subsp. strangulata]